MSLGVPGASRAPPRARFGPMQQRLLGGTGLSVSRLGLGTMGWGRTTDEHEARDQLSAFCEAGGTLVDTAYAYADGASETILGRLLGSVVPREDVVLATKAGVGVRRGQRFFETSRRTLLDCLDTSLTRLGVDHVDLFQAHVWSDAVPLEETLGALDHAVTSGRASYVGISNYTGWQTAQAATWQRAVPGRAPLASTQMEYSLLNRGIEDEVLPAARALGLGVLPWSPLGRGVLSGKYRTGTPSNSRGADPQLSGFVDPLLTERSSTIVQALSRAADGLGWSMVEVALAWVRDRPGVVAPIVGARTTTQLQESLAVEERSLPAELIAALDDVSAA
ncbi:oxidoreductase [Marmoricola endophyticus]|uniref:Oxidoreductase n=2 Tax=Marmoricola endophyticus TaxID=2040280 RepID=A0A917BAB5_9ACTN|nr:oxidoreductase [Marmoricola endophyticus]